ncbi:MAG: S1 RNA-binding domain-containing protein, partial [Lachnospiraceae bacterium]|nr:S1 RNA-binding domain-containing protein [Lachnospiraceae bacterium]
MIETGRTVTAEIDRMTPQGAYLTDGERDVLLPAKQIPDGAKIGDKLKV